MLKSKPTPTQRQLEFLQWEVGCFYHFGIRTFYDGHKDWDMKPMDLEGFNPEYLDCNDWIQTAKKAGANYAVLVTKHHDGFANWPSKYTEYGVKNTPWKDGKGDVVQEFVDACRKYDMKIGIYYSPAEFNQKENKMTDTEYDDYFINQISELLANYGEVDYLWFDACGSENHEYDKPRIIKAIRDMQPEILIFNMWDPDTRWIGNEAGLAQNPHWNSVDNIDISILATEQEKLQEKVFLPGECDFRIRLDNWFYSDKDTHTIKTLEELMGLYYYSVGRGSNFLINVSPDMNGLLPQEDKVRLMEFGDEVAKRFSNPIRKIENPNMDENTISIGLDHNELINHVVLKEDLTQGEGVKKFKISINPYPYGKPICLYEGYNIGNKAICQFPTVRAKDLIIEILENNGDYRLTDVSIHYVEVICK